MMDAHILGVEHWQAARHRRRQREAEGTRRFMLGPPPPAKRPPLAEIMGPWWTPPHGGDAA